MKTILAILVAAVLFTACSSGTNSTTMVDSTNHVDTTHMIVDTTNVVTDTTK